MRPALLLFTFASSAFAQDTDVLVDPTELGTTTPTTERALHDGGRVGVALLGAGAAVAASTAAASSLIEAVSRNDTNPNAPPANPELVQVGGFVTVSLMSVSAAVMLIGGALVVNDLAD